MRRLGCDRVRRQHGARARLRRLLVAGMHFGEDVSSRYGVAALQPARHAHGVIDCVLLRAAPCPELERSLTDRERAQADDDAVARGDDLAQDGRDRERRRVWVTALRSNLTLVRGRSGPVFHGCAFLSVRRVSRH